MKDPSEIEAIAGLGSRVHRRDLLKAPALMGCGVTSEDTSVGCSHEIVAGSGESGRITTAVIPKQLTLQLCGHRDSRHD
jgi:hypothetical protein